MSDYSPLTLQQQKQDNSNIVNKILLRWPLEGGNHFFENLCSLSSDIMTQIVWHIALAI